MFPMAKVITFVFILVISFSPALLLEQDGNSPDCPADCNSQIYCYGELLKTIQLAEIHEHPMNFVDKQLLDSEENILAKFQRLKEENKLDRDSLQAFVNENFAEDDPYSCPLRDIEIGLQPKLLDKVADPVYKQFVIDIQNIWPKLAIHVNEDAKDHPDRHSAIYLPNCFIKAGGFFKSQFYWDGYWTISGLLVTGMTETVKDMLLNYFHLIDLIGFIPNANRLYYTHRSQPPFFIPMIKKYLDATNDIQFLQDYLPRIEIEFIWWMENRAVSFVKDGKEYVMYQYRQISCNPRPEGYVEDYHKGQKFLIYKQRNYFYTQCHSVAESGLDFSTRQRRLNFYEKGYGTRRNLDITGLVPVELNAILAMNARLLSEWFEYFGNMEKAEKYRQISITLIQYIDEVFRIDYLGAWFDYDTVERRHRTRFYPTNLSPLYTMAYDTSKAYEIGKSAVEYLKKILIINSDGTPKFIGVPTSLIKSPEQWDFRNGWAPMQSFVIEGLYKTGQEEAVVVAQELAKIWVKTNWVGLQNEHEMFEKYDAVEMGKIGGGGTYKAQLGFGWSNGFVLVLLDLFGEILNHTDYENFKADTTGVDFNQDVRK